MRIAGVAQLVERQPSKLNVASSSLVSRSIAFLKIKCPSSSGVERFLGKEEVTGSNPVLGLLNLIFANNNFYEVT